MMSVRVDPRARVVYLVAIAIGVFLVRAPLLVAALAASQALAWLAVGLGWRRLARQFKKLLGFALFIVGSYALTAEDPATDRWVRVHLHWFDVPINTTGAILGVAMVLRVLAVVLASQVARAGDGRAIAAGLDKLHVPKIVGVSIDAVLALLGDGEALLTSEG